jgi:hypothetical protein
MRRKAKWVGHILRRNFLLRDVIEGQMTEEIIEVKGGKRRSKKVGKKRLSHEHKKYKLSSTSP